MKLLKSKTIIGVIAIVLGILVCFILSPVYNKSIEQKTKIVRIASDKIIKGQPVGKDAVEVVEVGSYNLPEDVVKDAGSVIGKYAAADLYKNDYLTPAKLSDTPLTNNEYLTGLDGKNGAISVTLQSFASGLSGKLMNGDIISLLSTDINDGSTEITPELKYVKVLSCTTADGIDVKEGQTAPGSEDERSLPVTVTLLVNDQQAKLLANMENTKKLHSLLVYRGREQTCRELLEEQDKIIQELDRVLELQETPEDTSGQDQEPDVDTKEGE